MPCLFHLATRQREYREDGSQSGMDNPRPRRRHAHFRYVGMSCLPIDCEFAQRRCLRHDCRSGREIASIRHGDRRKQFSIHTHGALTATFSLFLLPGVKSEQTIARHSSVSFSWHFACGLIRLRHAFSFAFAVILRFIAHRDSRVVQVDKLCVCPTAPPSAAQSQTRLPGGVPAPVDPRQHAARCLR